MNISIEFDYPYQTNEFVISSPPPLPTAFANSGEFRGNHECRRITRHFTYRTECLLKLNSAFYELSCDLFDEMPLAAIVNNQYLCLHGCISSRLRSVEDIDRIDRRMEIPHEGVMCDLLWSDPSPQVFSPSSDTGPEEDYRHNKGRNCAHLVSHNALCSFLNSNKLVSIIRAHQVTPQGFLLAAPNPFTGYPALITIFSAPNYCDVYKNKGAVILCRGCQIEICQFQETSHPFILPNFLNIFTWAIPFLISHVNEMLLSLGTAA